MYTYIKTFFFGSLFFTLQYLTRVHLHYILHHILYITGYTRRTREHHRDQQWRTFLGHNFTHFDMH